MCCDEMELRGFRQGEIMDVSDIMGTRNRNNRDRCEGCICNQLRRLQAGTEVDVFLTGGTVLEDVVFVSFNRRNCCAFFTDPTTEAGSTLIIDCRQIQALRIEAD